MREYGHLQQNLENVFLFMFCNLIPRHCAFERKKKGKSWPNGWRVGLVIQRLRVRVSGPAGIVGGGS